ncbi:Acriflavin resistance protein [Bathymodiolus heckerae thiotrophic gill symbiont]|uniref:efflux RND transporter permease subunit n=1 Tax=Bathymodiolus heckerae thiotrophic gill symbiont TaxID=1052212 RepID=UPI0010B6F6B5|nr:efflux RND transporter permease subunit [Bathymodiolus heckerae thiotrophic gill symbiont]SMN13250.1 Acriflavin resistance protein [Bathymodiolus heckerae thiotrophic gill symbiont]
MDSFFNFFVKQKKLALVFTVSIIAIGLLAFNNIQRDQFPTIDFELVTIVTGYPGASPEDVEQNITNPIEDELSSVIGIEKFSSISRQGSSVILVTLSPDVDDVSALKQDIQNAVDRIKSLPDEVVNLPEVVDMKSSLQSILKVNISSNSLSFAQLRNKIDEIADELALVDGVSEVSKEGYLDREIQIRIDTDKLYQYKLSLPQVMSAIQKRNQRYTVGSNNGIKNEKTIVVLAQFDQAQAVGDVIIKSSFDGPVVRLKDIATISDGNVEEKSIVRVNATKGFILKIRKQAHADIITTVDLIKEKLHALQAKKYPQVRIFYSSDLSKYVRNRLEIVTNNGMIGLLLVLLVLGVFLSLKTAFWVAVSLPVSLLGSVALLGMAGETINLISLAAMILVLGIVVDDSIIVAESIHHYKQIGTDKYHSAVKGFKRVIMPVITTILTTVLAFSSMFLMEGTMGKFIYVIPLVVIFALTLSFLEVTIALPAHLAGLNEKSQKKNWFNAIENWFERVLKQVLRMRYLIVIGFLALLGASIFFAATQMRLTLFPAIGADVITAKLKMPPGSSLQHTASVSHKVETLIKDVVGVDLDSLTNNIGQSFSHVAQFNIALVPSSERKTQVKTQLQRLKARTTEIVEAEKLTFSVRRPGPPQGEDIEIQLVSSNDDQRQTAANALAEILSQIEGVDNIDRDDDPSKSRIEVVLDFEKMARLNVDFVTVNRYLKAAFSGINVTDIRYGDTDVDFRVYLGESKQSEAVISELKISNRQSRPVPLKQFSSIRHIVGEPDFNHFDGQRSVKISASINDEIASTSVVIKQVLKSFDADNLYPAVRVLSEGGAKETKKSMQSFLKAFVMAVLIIFFLLILLFDSYTQPLLVLSAIPFSVIGVIWAFFLHGEPLSFFALLGTLALVGVIVNDSLVMVTHLNYLKQKLSATTPALEWIVQGAKDRLRAVILTSLTTLAGIIPLAYGIGGTDFILKPMALSLGYGLLFGTVMTLILLPCLYLMNYQFVNWIAKFSKK